MSLKRGFKDAKQKPFKKKYYKARTTLNEGALEQGLPVVIKVVQPTKPLTPNCP